MEKEFIVITFNNLKEVLPSLNEIETPITLKGLEQILNIVHKEKPYSNYSLMSIIGQLLFVFKKDVQESKQVSDKMPEWAAR
jgi:hypothetical protein